MASESEVKKSSSGFPFSPSLASETPSTMANMIRPRMLGPLVHSPLNFQVSGALLVLARRPDEGGPVLLHGGLHDIGRHSL